MRAKTWIGFGFAALSAVGCGYTGDTSGNGAGGGSGLTGELPSGQMCDAGELAPECAPLSGAIFTTTSNGSWVDANIYYSKRDVYLDGGPSANAPAGAAALPAGDYYFQVTDPSGAILLTNDPIQCRHFWVSADGVIVAPLVSLPGCPQRDHGVDQDHAELGAITIPLAPFDDTPNPAGEYKVWVTRTSDYVDPNEADTTLYVHGFAPSCSKIDNFNVEQTAITACKYRDNDQNGYTSSDAPVPNWPITITGPNAFSKLVYTGAGGCVTLDELVPGDYTVAEGTIDGWLPSGPVSFSFTLNAKQTKRVTFTNYCFLPCQGDELPTQCPDPLPPADAPVISPVL